jgi:hypothetical protein
MRTEVDRFRSLRAGLTPNQSVEPHGKTAFVRNRIVCEKALCDDQAQNTVTKELEPFVRHPAHAGVAQRPSQEIMIFKYVSDSRLKRLKRLSGRV